MGFDSSTLLVPVGVVRDFLAGLLSPPDGPPFSNFLFISSFSLRRARISSSLFRFILAISLCKDINSAIYSASDILSFTMLLVDTIYLLVPQILSTPWWALIVLERCWNQENDCLLSWSVGLLFPPSSQMNSLCSPDFSTPRLRELQTRMVPAKDTSTIK